MSKLDELIQELCPDGVVFQELGQATVMRRGSSVTKKMINPGIVPVVAGGRIPAYYCDRPNRDKDVITVAGSGANAGLLMYWDIPIFVSDAFSIEAINGVLTKFVFYVLQNKQQEIFSTKKGGGVPHVHISHIETLLIPIPPLPVQQEIVRILDQFTLLTAELTAELTARKKQYAYYRDSLLSFNRAKIPYVKLFDIATEMYRGYGIKRDQIRDAGTPCVRYGEIYTRYGIYFDECVSYTDPDLITNKKYIDYGDILFAITGEKIEEIGKSTAYMGKKKALVGGDILVMKHNQNPKYLSYALSTRDSINQKGIGKVKSKVVHTNAESLGEIKIPLPSLDVQQRIVDVLDNFEKICSDLNIGLPAEIEARKKQYEYYRDALLTFAETGDIIFTDRQTDRQTGSD